MSEQKTVVLDYDAWVSEKRSRKQEIYLGETGTMVMNAFEQAGKNGAIVIRGFNLSGESDFDLFRRSNFIEGVLSAIEKNPEVKVTLQGGRDALNDYVSKNKHLRKKLGKTLFFADPDTKLTKDSPTPS